MSVPDTRRSGHQALKRVAMVVVHSNPLVEPGAGDAGGMTVYVRQVARAVAASGVEVDIFTRRDSEGPEITEIFPGVRVRLVHAGPPVLPKEDLAGYLPEFTARLVSSVERTGETYDVIHSHYWLSGRVATRLSARWGVPFVHTFHTLGRVKNGKLRVGEAPEPRGRLCGEARVISEADAIVASTQDERDSLIDLYSAHPEKIHLIPPGVDHSLFEPGDRTAAKRALGLEGLKVVSFVGRLQPLKSPDVAVRALSRLVATGKGNATSLKLLIVGGASGASGSDEPQRLRRLAGEAGINGSIEFVDAQPHASLPDYYRASDVVIVPSASESFGLVALEAQASGVPVVASKVGGLAWIVNHGKTGYLVPPGDVEAFADGVWKILSNQRLATCMGRAAALAAGRYSWDRSAAELLDLYETATPAEVPRAEDAKKLLESRRNLFARH